MSPTTAERGYGYRHRRERDRWRPIVARGDAFCARCGGWIDPDTAWHLDHDTNDRSRYIGVSHEACNVSEPNRRRGRRRRPARVTTSRVW